MRPEPGGDCPHESEGKQKTAVMFSFSNFYFLPPPLLSVLPLSGRGRRAGCQEVCLCQPRRHHR